MCQDSRGYLWIGTADGDGVYDEAAFKNYGPADGLSGTYVTAIAESKHSPGTMWIGTLDGGLSKFKDGRFTKPAEGSPLTSFEVSDVLKDVEGTLLCQAEHGVLRLHGDAVDESQHEELNGAVAGIIEPGDSVIALVGGRAIVRYSLKDKATTVTQPLPNCIHPEPSVRTNLYHPLAQHEHGLRRRILRQHDGIIGSRGAVRWAFAGSKHPG